MDFHFSVPARILFGAGVSRKVGDLVGEVGGGRVLCVCDGGVKASGIVAEVTDNLHKSGWDVVEYDGVLPNPPDTNVEEAVQVARAENIDLIVAVGGGSCIDAAKAVNILLANPGPIGRYEGPDKVPRQSKPLIAIPTTAGTSSEITSVSVITNTREKRKMVILGRNVGASYALVDPLLTVNLPARLTAATGMDALTHAIESYVSVNASPCTEIYSLKAVEIIYNNLEKAVKEGSDLQTRSNMMLGCVIVGVAFNNADLGLVHGIAHPLSAVAGLPHGLANAATLPYVMEFNAEVVPRKMKDLAVAMGADGQGLSDEDGAHAAVRLVQDLSRRIGIPTLKELGITREMLDGLGEDASKEAVLMFNPRKALKADILAILEKAY